ncbi:Holliday junction branch migration DNA helicase RuvB [bacterium]|nr:Holliday junction branch migration DNA helicase RuvB [bacterium]
MDKLDPAVMRLKARREDGEFISLRPKSFAEFAGQTEVIGNLKMMVEAAKLRSEPLEHLLFSGPPGLGKTTLAHLIAGEMGAQLTATSGPLMERPGDLVAILSSLPRGQVLFIDEIHRLPRAVEETLYSAMEDFKVDIVTGTGPGARTITLTLEQFTLLGATTRSGLLSAPLRDRFGALFQMEFYQPDELAVIIGRAAPQLELAIDAAAMLHLAEHSRGTPRIALRLLRRIRDYAQVNQAELVTREICAAALRQLGIGPQGLDKMDRMILETVIDRFGGGPVGLDTLAAVFHEERDVLAEVHEPYLLKLGFLMKTPRGRVATGRAYEYCGLPSPPVSGTQDAPLFED